MATTNLLAIGTTQLSSSSFTVAGSMVRVALDSGTDGPAPLASDVMIEEQDSGTHWHYLGTLTSASPATSISAPGTYRVTRNATGASVGCDLFS